MRLKNNYHQHDVLKIKSKSRGTRGSFGRKARKRNSVFFISEWIDCRENWLWEEHGVVIFFYVAPHHEAVASFMSKIERKLKLKNKSKYGPTEGPWSKSVMWIRPSRFWVTGSMKSSLYSAFLRASLNYDHEKDNFKEALFSVPYTRRTRYAVERFLRGYTRFIGRNRIAGWEDQFFHRSNDFYVDDGMSTVTRADVDKLLVKPLKI